MFIAETPKIIEEFISAGFELKYLFSTDLSLFPHHQAIEIEEKDLRTMSSLVAPNICLAIFSFQKREIILTNGLQLALDAVRDPGNLGAIIRLCDWFGLPHLICSRDTVDCYNPKVIQSSMGSLARVEVVYVDLKAYLQQTKKPIYGAFMEGKSIYEEQFSNNAILVMGNEANGISSEIQDVIQHSISIPRFGKLQETESLNVATATAIILSEYKRTTET